MLSFLSIKNLALIERAELDFQSGFTVLTGETGAGKSIIISAVQLLLGGRADAESVRNGADKASVFAVFEPDRSGEQLILGDNIEIDVGDEIILRRDISANGRSRCFINDAPVTVKALGEAASVLVELHGQFSEMDIMRSGRQTALLDTYARNADELVSFRNSFSKLKALYEQRDSLVAAAADRNDLRDSISFKVNEIETANLYPEEKVELKRRRDYLTNAVKIIEGASAVRDLLTENEFPLTQGVVELSRLTRELSDYLPELREYQQELDAAAIAFDEINRIVGRIDDELDEGLPLEEIEGRLAELERLQRKYRREIPEIIVHLEELQTQLEELEQSEDTLAGIADDISSAEKTLVEAAIKLTQIRKEAAEELVDALEAELPGLGLEKASFAIEFEEPKNVTEVGGIAINSGGAEDIVFHFSANPGMPFRELSKVASGGELSRIMLALRAVTAEQFGADVIIFDEVDVGVGGRVAHAVGKRLRKISEGRQVICVTHLPQIAARANHQYLIAKEFGDKSTQVNIDVMQGDKRLYELARMLGGGEPPSDTTLQHAQELLENG